MRRSDQNEVTLLNRDGSHAAVVPVPPGHLYDVIFYRGRAYARSAGGHYVLATSYTVSGAA